MIYDAGNSGFWGVFIFTEMDQGWKASALIAAAMK